MSSYTLVELKTALGDKFKLIPVSQDDITQARIQFGGGDIAFIGIEHEPLIEVSLNARWHSEGEFSREGKVPDAAALAAACQLIAEEMKEEWESAGFTVEEEGSVSWFSYNKESDKKLPLYEVIASKVVPTLDDAVSAIKWISKTEREKWV